jgi:putative ABC transport system substrate-binding protein
MANVGYPPAAREMSEAEAAARTLSLEVVTLEIRRAEDITHAFEVLKGRADALYAAPDPLVNSHSVRISTLALGAQLPTMYAIRENVALRGLMSYGPSYPDQFRRTAELVDKIFKGAKPADLPVEQPTKFELVVNLTTAKALGLTIPESFLLRAKLLSTRPNTSRLSAVRFRDFRVVEKFQDCSHRR